MEQLLVNERREVLIAVDASEGRLGTAHQLNNVPSALSITDIVCGFRDVAAMRWDRKPCSASV